MKALRMSAVMLSIAATAVLWSGCATESHHTTWDRPDMFVSGEQEYLTRPEAGRAGQTEVPRYRRVEAPAPAPKAGPTPKATPTGNNCFTLKSDLLQLIKCVPAVATLGDTVQNDLTLTALANSANVVVTDTTPEGTTYVKSEPAATVEGQKLTWTFDKLDKGNVVAIKVWYKANREGNLVNCATMTAIPYGCAVTVVGKATLVLTCSMPASARIGTALNKVIEVKNVGSATAKDVVVTDMLPAGLTTSGERTFNVGDLAPGQARQITVPLMAAKRGQAVNAAVAKASNAAEVSTECSTVINQPGLAITKNGTKQQFLGRTASYDIVVSNTGDMELKDVVVTDTAAAATRIVKADGASVSGNTATWKIPSLAKGAKENFSVVLTSTTPGSHCNDVAAKSADGLTAKDQACTLWKGIPAILLQTKDDPDPIGVGENTTYTISVTNQGTADDKNVKVVVKFAKQIDPVSASGNGSVEGKTVTFPAIPVLGPKQVVTYTITAKGASTGDHRLKVDLTSDMLTEPVTHEESTHVY